uniref:Cytochrome b n=1 Tax=Tamerlania zarudnyi TaxID=138578 RepID=A0A894JSE9_9TREM|nr:cytochrome b [Tamerlania zarudnyi]QRV61240.1 cytochrome b [Tamerlania zarudnyi]
MRRVLLLNVLDLPVNICLSYWWCGGFMLGAFLMIQVVSGFVLSCFYVSGVDSFSFTVWLLSEDLFYWLIRYVHIWGVTFIFGWLYLHMGRSLYYSSYIKSGVWNVGFFIYLFMMVEAFLGYVLPWHQMSYWAATVLTSIFKSVPLVGASLYSFIVGGFSVTSLVLSRAYSAHICIAFVIMGLSVLHLFYLHSGGSNDPITVGGSYGDSVRFHEFFTFKDGFVLSFSIWGFLFLMWWFPDSLADSASYVEADPMVTPVSIKPEWYFLVFYAMLRSVDSKIGGLIMVLGFLFLMWLPTYNLSCVYKSGRQMVFWACVSFFFALTYLGSCHPEIPFSWLSLVYSGLLIILVFLYKVCWVAPFVSFDVVRDKLG